MEKPALENNSRLRRERERRGWSRTFVAEQIGSDKQSVARWERGEFFPTPQLRQQLCMLFGMDAEALGIVKPLSSVKEEKLSPIEEPVPLSGLFPPPSETSNEVPSASADLSRHKEHKVTALQRLLMIGGLLLVFLAVLEIFFPFHLAFPWANTRIVPGGLWITPDEGQVVGNMLQFAAHAYPTKPTDAPIDRVKFTISSAGHWGVGCIATPSPNSDVFSCTANLLQLRIVPGIIRVSFDVYDHQGNYNLAPHGTRSVYYVP